VISREAEARRGERAAAIKFLCDGPTDLKGAEWAKRGDSCDDPRPDAESRQQSKMEQEIGNLRLLNLLLLIAMLEAKNQPKENAIAIFSFCSCVC
jgi:hypothetical protein